MTKRRFDLVIFDCDGVLIDSEIIAARVLLAMLRCEGLDYDLAHFNRHFLGRGFPSVVATINAAHADRGLNLNVDWQTRYRATLLDEFRRLLRPMEGAAAALRDLRADYGVATGSSQTRASLSLDVTGLADLTEGRLFTSSQVSRGKPAPDLFLLAARSRGAAPGACLVVEDSGAGIEAALAAGMTPCRFTGGSHFADPAHRPPGHPFPHGSSSGEPIHQVRSWSAFRRTFPDLFV